MQFRSLGTGGPKVSPLGLGTWPIGGGLGRVDEREAIATIRNALDQGIMVVDTAQAYRVSEEIIGRALQGGYRQKCFLATKASRDFSPRGIQEALDNSLRALRVDAVDLYQIHAWNPAYPIQESMAAMVQLQEQGKVRYLGVSNFDADQMRQALQVAPFSSNQVGYNMLEQGCVEAISPTCRLEGVGVLVHSPLAKGLLTGRYTPIHRFAENDERSRLPSFRGDRFARYLGIAAEIGGIASSKRVTLVQLAIAWACLPDVVSCVLVGAKDRNHLKEHLGALDIGFQAAELKKIKELTRHAVR